MIRTDDRPLHQKSFIITNMAATNIFYRVPSQPGTKIVTVPGSKCTLQQFTTYLKNFEGLNTNDLSISCNAKVYKPGSCDNQFVYLQNNSHVDVYIPLLGGKGGFGSLLRAIGAQIEKTTNRDACRDLSGRRLRDIKREEDLKKLIALQEKLEEERKRRRKEKLEKLKKKNETSSTSASIQELVAMFDDHDYNKRRSELGYILEAAVDKGIINFKKRQQEEIETSENEKSKKSRLENIDEECTSKCEITTCKLPSKSNKIKKNDLWLGLEEEDEDI